MISFVLPVLGEHDFTRIAMKILYMGKQPEDQVIVVDNGSKIPYQSTCGEDVIRSDVNLGHIGALELALSKCRGDIIVYQHNDVLVYDRDYSRKVSAAFDVNEKLGIAGLFGARGVLPNGFRIQPESQMLGLIYGRAEGFPVGESWKAHSHYLNRVSPAATLDALCLMFRKSALEAIGVPENMTPHHAGDRILPLWFIEHGYDCATLGIPFDHASGQTSCRQEYYDFAKKWVEDRNIIVPEGESYDMQIYKAGMKQFEDMYADKLPLVVEEDSQGKYIYRWRVK